MNDIVIPEQIEQIKAFHNDGHDLIHVRSYTEMFSFIYWTLFHERQNRIKLIIINISISSK